jgi:hypothetical protein
VEFYNSVKLDGCIVCNNAKVLEGSSLTKCEVAGGYIVERKSKLILFLSDVDELEKSYPLTISIHCSRGERTEASRIPRGDLTAHRHIVRYSNINKRQSISKTSKRKEYGDWQGGLFIIWSPQPQLLYNFEIYNSPSEQQL